MVTLHNSKLGNDEDNEESAAGMLNEPQRRGLLDLIFTTLAVVVHKPASF